MKLYALILGCLLAVASHLAAEDVEIMSFHTNGRLTFAPVPYAGEFATYTIEWAPSLTNLWSSGWDSLRDVTADEAGQVSVEVPMFYRVVAEITPPAGSHLIPPGYNTGTDTVGDYSLSSAGFFMGEYPVTADQWDYIRDWALTNGYSDLRVGTRSGTNHPIRKLNIYDAKKWANALSEYHGMIPAYYTDATHTEVYRTGVMVHAAADIQWNAGFRLPTEDEWEYAARGGVSDTDYPWGNEISHADANYSNHPIYNNDTSPVGSFEPNSYGLYDVIGNVAEIVWRPRSATAVVRARGGDYRRSATGCRIGQSSHYTHDSRFDYIGFRLVLSR